PRRHETTSSRRILNQEEMETVLSRYGFQTIYFEDYSFTQQVAISAFCDIMIAPHGSGLVNSLFMPTNSSVIEYFPHKRVDSCGCYERCCVSRGQKYFDEDSIAQVQGDILVDLNRLEAILGSLGK
ncbi:MAG: glycosyltransferase family 61 protein, partial [Bdellovibrionales bacterium]|nr:glycosyltransferase family 61 protein [Bdellovibrionales bacterium]